MTTLATDLEGTLTTGETWKGMAAWMQAHGRAGPYQAFFYRHLPGAILARLGFGDKRAFQDRFMSGAAGLLAGLGQAELEAVGGWVVTNELWPKRRPEVLEELLSAMRQGQRIILCSATFQPILEAFAQRLGKEMGQAGPVHQGDDPLSGQAGPVHPVVALGTPLEMVNGVFTGRTLGPVRSGQLKADQLGQFLDGQPLHAAYGDTLPDLPMLELAQSPVAVYPDARLRQLAVERNWRVIG
ncbi:haloacid dehalogenase-like hydrolase [uncultured Meiothermus sp.]|jgi:phosphoserine phosphatase|uniref:HAD family hydrolase n=1 Tax=uncultured Meiothermus sp. TaxID=157471 RepID=UPI00262D0443|nr:haloacid dehalogenase-like hydrolase [uncultured Meiothermus sp.]